MVSIVTLAKSGPRIISWMALSVSRSTAEVAVHDTMRLHILKITWDTNLHQGRGFLSFAAKLGRNTVVASVQRTATIRLLSQGRLVLQASSRQTLSGEPWQITQYDLLYQGKLHLLGSTRSRYQRLGMFQRGQCSPSEYLRRGRGTVERSRWQSALIQINKCFSLKVRSTYNHAIRFWIHQPHQSGWFLPQLREYGTRRAKAMIYHHLYDLTPRSFDLPPETFVRKTKNQREWDHEPQRC